MFMHVIIKEEEIFYMNSFIKKNIEMKRNENQFKIARNICIFTKIKQGSKNNSKCLVSINSHETNLIATVNRGFHIQNLF